MFHRGLAAGLVTTLFACQAQAVPIQLNDFTGNKVEVSFSNLPLSFGGTPSVVADGITFLSGAQSFRTYPYFELGGGPAVQICEQFGCIMTDVDLDFISVDLPAPVARVGALLGIPNTASTARAEFYAGARLLGTVDIAAAPFEGVFAGWDAGANLISRVRFVDTAENDFVLGLSRFTYEAAPQVPEPSTVILLLMGLGAVSVGASRRRI